ncbi:uncharacterized protein LOC143056568 [Mytilus galloprovincialis]|uniref:uncharacterized protein LOC143056568 n=1 Tax=Mytilus galloprovincialis TaxID=29158 RepID=UPI003F7C11C6
MKKSWAVFCLLCSVLNVFGETITRLFPNGIETTCLGIVCPKNFIFEPCTLGDGKNDKCVECPPDRPISIAKFDSSFFYEPPDVCKNPHEVCVCAAEAKLMNQRECLTNLNPECQCDVSRGYFGSDPNLCELSENPCSSPGFQLALNGSCLQCADQYYKEQIGNGECKKQSKCEHPYVVDQPGDFKTKRTCKLRTTITTAFPGMKTTVPNYVSTSDKGYTSIPTSSATVNDTSTNGTTEEEPFIDEEVIWIIGVLLLLSLIAMPVVILLKRKLRSEDVDVENPGILNQLRVNIPNLNLTNESKKFEHSNRSVKELQKKSEEKESLLPETTLKLNDLGDKDDSNVPSDEPLNTIKIVDHNILQTRQTTELGSNLIVAGNSGIPDIGADQISSESYQTSGSGVISGKIKKDSSETLLKAIQRQLENQSDTLKNVESVVTNLFPTQIMRESAKSKNVSVQTFDNVLDSCEEFSRTGQLSQSSDNIATHENRNNSVETELKNVILPKDTNVKAMEQEPTSNVPILHVDSMLSEGNAKSSVSVSVYRLHYQLSGEDRPSRACAGSIECCDGQQHCLKSRVLPNFVTGKVLLKVPQTLKNMTDHVIFVPYSEHGGAKPYTDIQMEQLSKSLEMQSLFEPDSIILDLKSFETINLKRPEEHLAHWVHSISVQPHQMSVPHEQNQVDSGIDNNTGHNELQNEETFNRLSPESFEDDD